MRISIGICLAIVSFCSHAESSQGLSFGWSQSEAVYQGRNRDFVYQPETFSASYDVTFSESLSGGLGYWQGSDLRSFSSPDLMLDQSHQGVSLSLSYYLDDFGLHFMLGKSEEDFTISDAGNLRTYRESNEALDLSVSLDYLFILDEVLLTPSLSLGGYQLNTQTNLSGTALDALFVARETEQTNYIASAGIHARYIFELSTRLSLMPAIDLVWTEYLDSDADQSDYVEFQNLRGGRSTRVSDRSFSSSEDGSGFATISIDLMWDRLSLSLSYGETIAQETSMSTSAINLGFSF